jgi:hypothetical protein
LGIWLSFCGSRHGQLPGWPDFAHSSVRIVHFAVATAALSAGRREGRVMAEAGPKYNQNSDSSAELVPAEGATWATSAGTVPLAAELHDGL